MSLARVGPVIAAVIASAAAVVIAMAYTREPPPPAPPRSGLEVAGERILLTPGAPQWHSLQLAPAERAKARWTDPSPARVRVDETRAARVGAPLPGRVTRVFVELGERVRAGAPLFAVASQDLAALRAEQDRAALAVEHARAALERVKAMVAEHALAAKDALAAERELKEAELSARLAADRFSALHVSARGAEFVVHAPKDGVVVEKNVLPAQSVAPDGSAALVMLADLSTVWIVADLFEADAAALSPGAQARVSAPSLPGVTLDARVDLIGAVVDPARHTVTARARLQNRNGALRPNAYVQIQFALRPVEGVVEVPTAAIVSDGAKQYAWVQEASGQFARREVAAASHGSFALVAHGLAPGDVVVSEGALLLDNELELSR